MIDLTAYGFEVAARAPAIESKETAVVLFKGLLAFIEKVWPDVDFDISNDDLLVDGGEGTSAEAQGITKSRLHVSLEVYDRDDQAHLRFVILNADEHEDKYGDTEFFSINDFTVDKAVNGQAALKLVIQQIKSKAKEAGIVFVDEMNLAKSRANDFKKLS